MNMPTPTNFGGGGVSAQPMGSGAGADPISQQINALYERIEKHMNEFETEIKPMFKNVPHPSILMGKIEDKYELKVATGQASEDIHRRFLSLQQRTQTLDKQPAPAI